MEEIINMITKKLHYLSGLTLAIFISLHLFNHFYSVFGVERHIALMDSLRLLYRNIIVETILLFLVLSQIVSGIKLFFIIRKKTSSLFEKIHIWSGLYIAIFLVIHVSAVMAGRFILQIDTNFYFGVAGLNTFPINLFFVPYYALAIISFFGHIASIHYQKMKVKIFGLSPEKQAVIIIIIGAILTLAIFFGLTNRFQGVAIPGEYNILTGK